MLVKQSIHLADKATQVALARVQIGLQFLVFCDQMFMQLLLFGELRQILLLYVLLLVSFLATL